MHYANLQTALGFLHKTQAEIERIRLVQLRDEACRANKRHRLPESTPNMVDYDYCHLKEAINALESASQALEAAIGQELTIRFKHEVKSRSISNWLNNC